MFQFLCFVPVPQLWVGSLLGSLAFCKGLLSLQSGMCTRSWLRAGGVGAGLWVRNAVLGCFGPAGLINGFYVHTEQCVCDGGFSLGSFLLPLGSMNFSLVTLSHSYFYCCYHVEILMYIGFLITFYQPMISKWGRESYFAHFTGDKTEYQV